ncbi:MAG: hypothetical protein IJU42_08145 [Erysipelotrichaceae bacterium]|jgi:hypothetical protein|nr:hypothetical protein [Erysipelotrichaceae bacterium]
MKLSEMLKQDRKKFSELPDSKSRMNFIWDYYKIPIIAFLSVLAIALISLLSNIGHQGICMYALLLNNDSLVVECDDTVFDRILQESDFNTRGKKTDVNARFSLGRELNENADIETLQVLTALFTVSDLDLYVADQYYFDYFAKEDGFADLSLLIDKDLINRNEDDLYYYVNDNGQRTLAGIILHEGSPVHEAGYYHNDVIMGVVAKAENLDAALAFVKQILTDRN